MAMMVRLTLLTLLLHHPIDQFANLCIVVEPVSELKLWSIPFAHSLAFDTVQTFWFLFIAFYSPLFTGVTPISRTLCLSSGGCC